MILFQPEINTFMNTNTTRIKNRKYQCLLDTTYLIYDLNTVNCLKKGGIKCNDPKYNRGI